MRRHPRLGWARAFSLLEMMVSMFVLIVLLGIIVAVTNSVSDTVLWSSSKLDAFASARSSFDLLTRRLSTATLNTYWDYQYPKKADGTPDTTKTPLRYIRQSDLQFLIQPNAQNPGYGQELYFQSPESFSMDTGSRTTRGLLNASGFFVQYCNNDTYRPETVSAPRWRYRLMQGFEPTENLEVFELPNADWINRIKNGGSTVSPNVTPLADNVIALIIWPRVSALETGATLSANYNYDSRKDADSDPQPATANQLPPTVQVTMVTLSEASAIRMDTGSATRPKAIEDALVGKFEISDQEHHTADLQELSEQLTAAKAEYHIFNTAVTLREAKWSDE